MPRYVQKCIRRCYIDVKLYDPGDIAVSDKKILPHFECVSTVKDKKPKKDKDKDKD